MNPALCPDSIPSFLHLFDLSIAPQLIYYTYIPTLLVSIFLGSFVYRHDGRSLASKLLFLIAASFSLWTLDIFVLWIGAYNNVVMFGWQITPVFEIPLFIFSVYFAYVITDKERRDVHPGLKLLFCGIMIVAFLFLPTHWNITNYDLSSCEGVPGRFWDFMYMGEMVVIAWIIGLCLNRFRALKRSDQFRKQIAYFAIGITSFLVLFTGSNLVGQITGIQQISFIGSLGMTIFLGFLTYMIVKFKIFNLKVFATQALMIATSILIGSRLFFPTGRLDFIVTAATLVAFIVASIYVVRSVKREIEAKETEHAQREKIEQLARGLEVANKGQENLMHIMNHQIKGHLGTGKNIFAELLESDDYGRMPDQSKPLLAKGLESMDTGIDYVQGILRGASAVSGTLPYEMQNIDLKALTLHLTSMQKEIAEKSGLSFELCIPDGDYATVGDATQLEEAFQNLVTNAIKYNSVHGSIKVDLMRKGQMAIFSVRDTGVGISEEDKIRLFTPGGRGKDSLKYNIDSSGFGLAFVKAVAETHHGRVYYQSNSPEAGTTFFVELPITRQVGSEPKVSAD